MNEQNPAQNGATVRWRLDALERELATKADAADVARVEGALNALTQQVNRLVYAVFGATLSGAVAAVLLAVNLSA